MGNSKFITVTNEKGEKSVYFHIYIYGWCKHASFTESQNEGGTHTKIGEPSADVELLKIWNHATIERKYGVYASKDLLTQELTARGYVLGENKHRWFKPLEA